MPKRKLAAAAAVTLAAADSACASAATSSSSFASLPLAIGGTTTSTGPRTSRYISKTKLESTKKEKKNKPQAAVDVVARTQSFQPVWAGTLDPPMENPPVDVHTVILGTHPSIASLNENQYFGYMLNAFWWIAGDCLGFRRNSGISPSSGKPYEFAKYLRYGNDKILPYNEQLRVFTSKGFALWDVVKSCERKGSLDQNIKNEEPNDIRGFCAAHPSVKRIVLANGTTQAAIVNKHWKEWWFSGELMPGSNEKSITAFKQYAKKTDNFKDGKIKVIVALAVSPAAAKASYEEKREFWHEHVYGPGLRDYQELQGHRS